MLDPHEQLADRYEIVRRIGRGAMGAVYLATDLSEQRDVAIKVLTLPPDDYKVRFQREVRLMSQLRHPHVIEVLDSGEHDDLPFLVMAYVAGKTLAEQYPQAPPDLTKLRVRLGLSCQIASALAYIHRQGVIHRDITPSNIMLEGTHCFLMDFGLAKTQDAQSNLLTHIDDVTGTAAYMSPEQIQGQLLDSRSDLYAFGCLLYWLVTGQAPFAGSALVALVNAHVQQTPLAPSSYNPLTPAALDTIILKLLAKAPEARYSSASQVLVDLRQLAFELEDVTDSTLDTLAGVTKVSLDLSANPTTPSISQQRHVSASTVSSLTPKPLTTAPLAPTSLAPTSLAPTSLAPTSSTPTSSAPTSSAPTSSAHASFATALPPSPRQRLLHAPLLGRATTWQRLAGKLAAFPERGHLVIIDNAEPGRGATRLLKELYRHSRARALPVVIVRHDGQNLLGAWLKSLRRYAQHVDAKGAYLQLEPRLQKVLAGQSSQLSANLVEPADAFNRLPEDVSSSQTGLNQTELSQTGLSQTGLSQTGLSQAKLQQDLLEAVSQLFVQHPCVVLVDNLNNADEASSHLLCHLLETKALDASLVVLAGRCDQVVNPLGDFLKQVSRQHTRVGNSAALMPSARSSYVALEPLSDDAMQQLLEARLGAPLEASLAAYVCHQAAGSPRAAEVLLRTLLGGNKLSKQAQQDEQRVQWVWNAQASQLPSSAQDVLQERLKQLPRRVRATLNAASTLGLTFEFASLQDLYLYDVLQQVQVNQPQPDQPQPNQSQLLPIQASQTSSSAHALSETNAASTANSPSHVPKVADSTPRQATGHQLVPPVHDAAASDVANDAATDDVDSHTRIDTSACLDNDTCAGNDTYTGDDIRAASTPHTDKGDGSCTKREAHSAEISRSQAHLNTRNLSQTLRNALLDDLTVLVQADFIQETSSGYRFAQPQVQQLLHADLEPSRRQRYHEHLAEVLSQRGNPAPDVLAWHYAEANLPYHAAAHALAAARRAETLFANDQSEAHYRFALDLLPPASPQALQTRLALAAVLERTGKWQEAGKHYQHLLATELKPQALHALGRLEQTRGHLLSSERYLRQALRLSPHKQAVNSDLGRTLTLKGEFDAAKRVLIRNLRAAEALTPDADKQAKAIAQAHIDLAELAIHCGDKASAQTSLALAQRCPPQYRHLHAKIHNLLGVTCRLLEQLDDAETHYHHAETLYEEIGDLERSLSVQLNRSNLLADKGAREAAFTADRSLAARAKRIGDKKHEAIAVANQGEELLARGELDTALQKLHYASKLFQKLNYSQYHNHVQLNVLLGYIRQGHLEDAYTGLDGLNIHLQHTSQPQQRARFELVLAEYWLWQQQTDLAVDILEEATETLRVLQDVREAIDGYILLAQAYAFDSPSEIETCLAQASRLAEDVLDPLYAQQVAYVQAYLEGNSTRAQTVKMWLEQHGYGHFSRRVRKLLALRAID